MANFEIKEGTNSADSFKINYEGNCTIYGYGGNDTIQIGVGYGTNKNNVVYGGADDDYITSTMIGKFYGENDNDTLVIGANDIFASGGDGDDNIIIKPSTGSIIYGGKDSDTFSVQPQGGKVTATIMDLTNKDTIFIDSSAKNFSYKVDDDGIIFSDEGKSFELTLYGISDISQIYNVKTSYFMGTMTTTLGKLLGVSSAGTISATLEPETETTTTTTSGNSTTTTKTETNITTTTTTEETTSTTVTPTVSAATSQSDTVTSGGNIINNYYGDVYNISGNSGTVVVGSSVSGGVGNIVIINKESDTYTYNGGDKVINNYQQGEVVRLDDYQGLDDISGNSFYIKSQSGRLEIQNSRDKFIGYSAGNSEVIAYSYVASGGGNVDGRDKSQAEILIGAENANNQIFAGSGGSSVWGGNGGTDTLVGGDGYDEFFYAMGSGSDVVQNAGDNDVVNLLGVSLSQITYAEVSYSDINIGFTDGGNLKLQGQAATGFKVEGVTYTANRSTGGWYTK